MIVIVEKNQIVGSGTLMIELRLGKSVAHV